MNRFFKSRYTLISLALIFLFTVCSEDPETIKFKKEAKHFKQAQKLYFEANRYLKQITEGDSIVGSFSDEERDNYINKLSDALKEAKLVSDSTLYKLHPKLPVTYKAMFIRCIEQQLKGFTAFDAKASIEGQKLHNVWIDWWNNNYKEFKKI